MILTAVVQQCVLLYLLYLQYHHGNEHVAQFFLVFAGKAGACMHWTSN